MACRLLISAPTDIGRIELGKRFDDWRRLDARDARAIAVHFAGIDADQRRLRFGRDTADAAPGPRCARISGQTLALELEGRIAALLEVLPDAHGASVELALSFDRRVPRIGFARRLTAAAIQHAAMVGFAEIEFTCLARDAGLRCVATCFGFSLRHHGDSLRGTLRVVPWMSLAA